MGRMPPTLICQACPTHFGTPPVRAPPWSVLGLGPVCKVIDLHARIWCNTLAVLGSLFVAEAQELKEALLSRYFCLGVMFRTSLVYIM